MGEIEKLQQSVVGQPNCTEQQIIKSVKSANSKSHATQCHMYVYLVHSKRLLHFTLLEVFVLFIDPSIPYLLTNIFS